MSGPHDIPIAPAAPTPPTDPSVDSAEGASSPTAPPGEGDDLALSAVYDKLLDAAVNDEPTTPHVDDFLSLLVGHPVRDEWVASLAQELLDDLEVADPDPDAPTPPAGVRVLQALQQLTVTEQISETAWTLLYDVDSTTLPTVALTRYDTVIGLLNAALPAHRDLTDATDAADAAGAPIGANGQPLVPDDSMLSDLHASRAVVHERLGNGRAAVDDWAVAYRLAQDDASKLDLSVCAASAAVDLPDLETAAEWAWVAAGYLDREAAPDPDVAEGLACILVEAAAQEEKRCNGDPSRRLVTLVTRLVAHPDWLPGEVVTGVHAAAARVHLTRNDVSAAAAALAAGQSGWSEAPPWARTEWHLARGLTASLQLDVAAVEAAVREVTPAVDTLGDVRDREMLAGLVTWLSVNSGQSAALGADHPVSLLNRLSLRLRDPASLTFDDLALADRAIAGADREDLPHLVVGALTIRANIRGCLRNVAQAQSDLHTAQAVLERMMVESPGGFPAAALQMTIDMTGLAILAAAGDAGAAAEQADQLWRRQLRDGSLAGTAVAGAFSCVLWDVVLHQPFRAVPAGVAALTSVQELASQRGRSEDRFGQTNQMLDTVRQLVIHAVHGTGDPRAMAEVLEVARAQDMPESGPHIASVSELAAQLSLHDVLIPSPDSQPATGTTRLPPPPLVVMPWSSVALAEYLAYPRHIVRAHARLTIGWPDLPQT
ncbi:MAG: hypothetical protein M3010_07695 [Candidatus Dormibacteraeota bacterium]|nr:hypothetical protein [Candidatus Dormibacteraeota bacterium]